MILIFNMSLGTTVDSQILHKAIKDAYDTGMLIIAAGGNGVEGTSIATAQITGAASILWGLDSSSYLR